MEEGTVIATAEDAQGGSIDYTAPYDCVLLELPVSSGDELEAGGEVAMVMGTEGFTMGIAVDEQDISAVAVGQEVAFTVDAVDGEYIRLWRSLHNHLFVRRQRFQWCGWQRLIPVCAGSIVIVSRPRSIPDCPASCGIWSQNGSGQRCGSGIAEISAGRCKIHGYHRRWRTFRCKGRCKSDRI